VHWANVIPVDRIPVRIHLPGHRPQTRCSRTNCRRLLAGRRRARPAGGCRRTPHRPRHGESRPGLLIAPPLSQVHTPSFRNSKASYTIAAGIGRKRPALQPQERFRGAPFSSARSRSRRTLRSMSPEVRGCSRAARRCGHALQRTLGVRRERARPRITQTRGSDLAQKYVKGTLVLTAPNAAAALTVVANPQR